MNQRISAFHGAPDDARRAELVDRVHRLARVEGVSTPGLSSLSIYRASGPTPITPSVYEPSLCIVVQGSKRALIGNEVFEYDPMNYLVVSVTLPARAQVVGASPEKPYLCLRISLDPERIAELLLELGGGVVSVPKQNADCGMYVAELSGNMLDSLLRLVRLLDEPQDLSILAPAALREVYYRVLTGELGHQLRDIAEGSGQIHRVVRAIDWIKRHYAEPLRIEELAASVHLSPSALHHRFKAMTACSPLQYQKQLRLHEARRLMFADGLDCAEAGHRVGYESPSQFSREYRRLFGAPPRREISQLREQGRAA